MASQVGIYILDPYYGETGAVTEGFEKHLKDEFGLDFEYDDIGAGVSLPAFLAFIQENPVLSAAIALYFSGNPIKKNYEAWRDMAKAISKFAATYTVILNREGAAVLANDALLKKLGHEPTSMHLSGYGFEHYFQTENLADIELKEIGTEPQYIGFGMHIFEVVANDHVYRIAVDATAVTIIEVR